MTANAPIHTHARFCTVQSQRLTERDAEPALKAAALLGLRVASIEDLAARTVPEAPPQRDIFGHCNGNYGVARMPERRGKGGLMTGKADQSSTRMCALNDELRRFGRGGRIMITPGSGHWAPKALPVCSLRSRLSMRSPGTMILIASTTARFYP
jgi:hypothetical protein